jgi:hypothetical protein
MLKYIYIYIYIYIKEESVVQIESTNFTRILVKSLFFINNLCENKIIILCETQFL